MNTNFCAFYFCFLKYYSFYPSIITPLASPQPCQSARSIIGCARGVCILLISSLPNLCELWTRGICMFLVSGVEIVSVHDFEGGKLFFISFSSSSPLSPRTVRFSCSGTRLRGRPPGSSRAGVYEHSCPYPVRRSLTLHESSYCSACHPVAVGLE